jgi:DNA-binding response OmpR family regulator
MPHSIVPRSILIADDDELFRRSLACSLEQAGYQVQMMAGAKPAIAIVEMSPPNLVLLDIGFPHLDGLEAIRRIRDICPVIFVSARRRALDEVLGLELGAEDYITKPFDLDVLLARIRAVLRRAQPVRPATRPTVLVLGDLTIDVTRHTVTCNAKPVYLSPLEFLLLYTLAQEAWGVVSTQGLLRRVWGEHYVGEPQIVYVYIRTLREKLEENPQVPQRILTVRGIGYRFVPREPDDA